MSSQTAEHISRSDVDSTVPDVNQAVTDSPNDRPRDLRGPRSLNFYVNGDRFFRGKKMYVTPSRHNKFSDLLDDLTGQLPANLNLPYGVRQIFTPVRGRRVHDIEDLVDGQAYVCAGFEGFKMIKYGRSQLEPWSLANSQPNPMTEQEPEPPGSYRYRSNNNAFPPGRYFRTSQSYPQRRWPDRYGPNPRVMFGASLANNMERPKVITIIRNGEKPRNSVKILLNRRAVQTYEQLVADISEAFGSKLKSKVVRRLFTISGKEVQSVSDFFRGDEYFVAFGAGETNLLETDIVDILEELFQDAGVARSLLLQWKKNERRRRRISPSNQFLRSNKVAHVQNQAYQLKPQPVQDKRDSGFDSADVSTSRSEPDQMERKGVLRPHKRMGMDREGYNEEEGKNQLGSLSEARRVSSSQEYYLLKKLEKDRWTAANEENERLKKRRQNIAETERGVFTEGRLKEVLVPLKNVDNQVKKINDAREKDKCNDKETRKDFRKRQEESKLDKLKREELDERGVAEVAVSIVKDTKGIKEQEPEIVETSNVEKVLIDDRKIINNKEENVRCQSEHSMGQIKPVIETNTKDTSSASHNINTQQTNIVSAETAPTDNVQMTESVPYLATGVMFAQIEAKDKNNNQQKEKRKQERDEQQQRKRAKTRIIRKTKLERQVGNDEYVLARYEMGRKLGDGNFAIVRQSRKKETGQEFAVKVIDKAKLKGKDHMVENEIDILKDCCHHNIVRLYEEYETLERIYLVMELVKGGDLFDAIIQNVKFGELDSTLIVKDLCSALFYLHSRSIVHRDLKPENVLVHRNKDGSINVKLADFGLAMEVKKLIYTVCGTPTYVAPEILMDIGYSLEVDMWAMGVITYILLCGFPPFRSRDRNQTELFEFIKAGDFEFLSPYWDNVSRSAKDLISRLLVVDRKRRYTAVDVLCHKWVLCNGQTDVLPESAATVDTTSRQTRRELEEQAKLNCISYQRLKEKKKIDQEGREE